MTIRTRIATLLCVISTIILASISCTSKEKLILKFNPPPGKKYQMSSDYWEKITKSRAGNPKSAESTILAEETYEILNNDGQGETEMTVRYDRVREKLQSPITSFEYDSANPPSTTSRPEQEREIAAIAGHSFKVKLNSLGMVTHISGGDELIEKILKADIPNKIDRTDTKKRLSNDSFKEQFESTFAIFPKRPVAVGETWESNFTKESVGGFWLFSKTNYRLKERKDGIAFIEIDGKLNAGPLTGVKTGHLEIIEKTGWIKAFEIKVDVSGIYKLEDGDVTLAISSMTKGKLKEKK